MNCSYILLFFAAELIPQIFFYMKKLITTFCAVTITVTANAQGTRVKLSDVVAKHQEEMAQKEQVAPTSIYENKEKGDYHFQRWLWYWQQHTDKQGYIIPKVEAYKIYKQYEAEQNRAAAKTTADQSNWKAIGPYSQAGVFLDFQKDGIGRINTMAFHPTDIEQFIVGTAGGGAWVTNDFGSTWRPLTQNMISSSVSDIDYNPQNPGTIYICTGDREYGVRHYKTNFAYSSIGLIKSTDSGKTWNTVAAQAQVSDFSTTNSFVINSKDTLSLTLATDKGILKSYDGGKTWSNAIVHAPAMTGYTRTRIYELVYHPTDSAIIYATARIDSLDQDGDLTLRDTSNPAAGWASAAEILRSTDGGMNWDLAGTLPGGTRGAIAVTPTSPDILKVVFANNSIFSGPGLYGVFHSNNKGDSFIPLHIDNNCSKNILSSSASGTKCGGQGTYDLCITIDPTNINHVIVGGVNLWESKNGGVDWTVLAQGTKEVAGVPLVHADHHFLGYQMIPGLGPILMDCNDGGISYYGPDPNFGVVGWHDIASGMNITQFYRIGASDKVNYVVGGAQDNGSNLIDRTTNLSTPIGYGDGVEAIIDPVDPNILYAGYVNGDLFKWDLSKGVTLLNFNMVTQNINRVQGDGNGAWVSPVVIDPNDHKRLITAFSAIYASPDQGETWDSISHLFPSRIGRLAMCMSAPQTIYATEDGESKSIHYTHNNGTSWSTFQHPYTEPRISDIKVDQFNKDHFWITFPGFGQNKVKIAEYNMGTWTTMNENLPDLPVLCMIQDTSNKALYIGTYTGVYYRTPMMGQWEKFSTNLPVGNVSDLELNYKTGELIAGTWGRGMWATPKYKKPDTTTGIEAIAASKQLDVYPNPSAGSFTVQTTNNDFTDKNVTIQISDVAGKLVYSEQASFKGNSLQVKTQGLSTGNYILKITNAMGNKLSEKLLINKE